LQTTNEYKPSLGNKAPSNENVPMRRHSKFEPVRVRQRFEQLWSGQVRRDTRNPEQRSVIDRREHSAAMAFVRGSKWYARQLLEFQTSPNRRLTCQALIESSHRLLEESRRAILRTKNILAFSRSPKEMVN